MKRPPLIILVILIGVMLTACAAPPAPSEVPTPPPPPAEEPAPPVVEPATEVLAHWTGMGDKMTEQFIISKVPWTIVWEFQPDEPSASGMYINKLVVYVHRIGVLQTPVAANAINVKENKAGSTGQYVSGTFYLEIVSTSGTWDIQAVGLK